MRPQTASGRCKVSIPLSYPDAHPTLRQVRLIPQVMIDNNTTLHGFLAAFIINPSIFFSPPPSLDCPDLLAII